MTAGPLHILINIKFSNPLSRDKGGAGVMTHTRPE